MRRVAVVVVLLAMALAGCEGDGSQTVVHRVATERASASPAPEETYEVLATPSPRPRPPVAAAVWLQAVGGDGDSWKDAAGHAYRLGLVNAPETNECFGSRATAERKQLTAAGFRAKVYTHDTYGRGVSVVTLRDGRNLNVWLARHGFVNDKYLADFRHENPSLAAQLDAAFAAAKAQKLGLWSACAAKPKPQPLVPQVPAQPRSSCHPDYATCIPIKGDGSGNGAPNDLDCGDIGQRVQLRQAGVDPYRLDADGDGTGCDSY